jgi:ABC-type Fe3+/spermidine/putrescine transport system ATPase subunit
MLEARSLSKRWPRFSLELSLSLADGEIAAILGPSGCGKSTLLRLLSGLERPDSGSILFDGRDIGSLPPERRGIGMVFQDFALFPHMSVRRNIEYGPKMKGSPRRERRAAAETLASAFEISQLLERSPYSLSGGEQQRVALARALAAKPSIVLLDEPLSSLDASLRRRLRADIAMRLRESGLSAILVTHDAEEALSVADRVLVMRDGRIEAEGEPEGLYESPPSAWCAAFLGRGPLLDVLSIERAAGSFVASTAIGAFRCAGSAAIDASKPLSLYFSADSPLPAGPDPANLLEGVVAMSSYAGRYRRVTLACSAKAGPDRGASLLLELEIPSAFRVAVGERIALYLPSEKCMILA